ncbi:MAG: hypothetical protein M1827_003161 [Pycnora praestabilis]|nr:MAG: hypothetical protein M1827_003161 [Pycnora praestabilis]
MPETVHLPNGQTLTVSPVFGGLFFKSNDLNTHHSIFPPGWTVVLHSEDYDDDEDDVRPDGVPSPPMFSSRTEYEPPPPKKHSIHRFRRPTLRHDNLFISSISNPSSGDFKPATSPTRQIAMMLWATLWYYFHQPEPDPRMITSLSAKTADAGRPKGEWRINIKREGIFKGRNLLQKLERMGLITSEDSSVGADMDERSGEGWQEMFISRRTFWQLDARLFLFTLSPTGHSPYPASSPNTSRPSSPAREYDSDARAESVSQGLWTASSPPGPFASSSHLPTYYPPPPLQYTFTNHIRHPIRTKPPRQGETFYTRYVQSLNQYISFRVASFSSKSPTHSGPGFGHSTHNFLGPNSGVTEATLPSISSLTVQPCDSELLHKWMNDPRVSHYWGEAGPQSYQESFLRKGLQNKHSFPIIGCWDGKPFAYFEIYWVKEDNLGKYLGGEVNDYDRGIHCLVGEQEFRGGHRVKVWLSALVHYCWLADYRTQSIMLEPRIDNQKLIDYLQDVGFYKEKELAFPHKQSALMKIRREAWEGPAL